MDFAEKNTHGEKHSSWGGEGHFSNFFQGGWWAVGNRKSLSLFRGCIFFFPGVGPFPFRYTNGGGWVCGKGLGGYGGGGMFSGRSFVHPGVGS